MIDLHCHSSASDGTVPPEDLPNLAAQNNLTAIALTDHDTADGLQRFLEAGKKIPNLTCIPGIELAGDGKYGNHLHIVGLFLDPNRAQLIEATNQLLRYRHKRNKAILVKLAELGMHLDYDEIIQNNQGAAIGRPHIVAALVKHGYVKNHKVAYDKFVGRSKPAYVTRQVFSLQQVINLMHDSSGIAIWAHPMSNGCRTGSKTLAIATELKTMGLDGLEAYHTDHKITHQTHLVEIAKKLDLAISGGTDFHGEAHPDTKLGIGTGNLNIPDHLVDGLIKAHARRHG